MKTNNKIVLLLMIVVTLMGCATKSKNLIVKGKINNDGIKCVVLYGAKDGNWVEIARTDLDSLGRYNFDVEPSNIKMWAIARTASNQFDQPIKARFYSNNGGTIELNFNDKNWNNYTIEKMSRQNELLREWDKVYSKTLYNKSGYGHITYKELYPKIDDFLAKAKELSSKAKTGDKEFDQLFKFILDKEPYYGLINFRFQPNSIHPSANEVPSLYSEVCRNEKFDTPLYLEWCYGVRYMRLMQSLSSLENRGVEGFNSDDYIDSKITVDNLFAVKFIDEIKSYRSVEDFNIDYAKYGKFLYNEEQKQIVDKYMSENKRISKGQPAFNFSFPNTKGEMVSMADFKGKVVLIDIWATWCGPCRAQIPHLNKLEHEFADNKDIVFVSISTDSPKDKDKWLKMIKDEKMGGIQLLAGDDKKEIMEYYKIKGIPRFMVFDKNGNIYSSNSPRPSDPKLKDMLLELLNK